MLRIRVLRKAPLGLQRAPRAASFGRSITHAMGQKSVEVAFPAERSGDKGNVFKVAGF